ncbi:AcrR family transcriptional regulator [Paraburkholderia sp. WSM4174]
MKQSPPPPPPPPPPPRRRRLPSQKRASNAARARLLDAALRLTAEKNMEGMEGVASNEITGAADVGFGSWRLKLNPRPKP